MEQAYAAVARTLSRYFDGLHHSDVATLTRVFHPKAHYACATEGRLLHLGMEEYLAIVAERPSPASRGEARTDAILSIEFAGPVTAFARVVCSIAPRRFTDFLTLVSVDGEWRIISKVFHYELADQTSGTSALTDARWPARRA